MKVHEDYLGNLWFKQEKHEHRLNHAVKGAHAVIPFQCEDCWMLNLEGRLPVDKLDDTYKMMIRRANLDAIAGRAESTIVSHAATVLRTAKNCANFGKTPAYEPLGPHPFKDKSGMGLAVEMEYYGATAKGRIADHIQWDSMRKPRSTYTQCWKASPRGIEEGYSFSSGLGRATFTSCPSQSDWFAHFCLGAESRIGFASEANKPLHIRIVVKTLNMIKEEARRQPTRIANELYKVGAAMAVSQAGSLRGPETFMLDLAGIRKHIMLGKHGTMPDKPLDLGTDLFDAPHVYLALIGKFKGENGVREHLVPVASESLSGLETRWWIEKLIEVRESEGHVAGPAFGRPDGSIAPMAEYDDILHTFLKEIQSESNDLILETDDVVKNYRFFRSFRKSAEGRARAAGLDSDMQNAMNRWKKIESARGRRPKFNMVDHYSTARDLMPVTWRYSYVQ